MHPHPDWEGLDTQPKGAGAPRSPWSEGACPWGLPYPYPCPKQLFPGWKNKLLALTCESAASSPQELQGWKIPSQLGSFPSGPGLPPDPSSQPPSARLKYWVPLGGSRAPSWPEGAGGQEAWVLFLPLTLEPLMAFLGTEARATQPRLLPARASLGPPCELVRLGQVLAKSGFLVVPLAQALGTAPAPLLSR